MRRVAVTGMGVVTCTGIGVEAMWDSLAAGRSGISTIEHFDTSAYPSRIAGYIHDFDPSTVMASKESRRMARFQQFAMVAAHEALSEAGLTEIDDELALRAGVIVGSGIGGLGTMEEQTAVLNERGPGRISPFLVPMMIVDLAAGHISIRYNLKGINYAPVSACATGNHSIGEAFEAIRRNDVDVVVAGGFDAGVTPLGVAGFSAARALSTRNDDPQGASRPWSASRDGFVIAEGGAVLVLEEWDHAVARGAHIRAEILGYGASADAYHVTAPAPDGSGAMRSMRQSLEKAGLVPSDVGYINAHGTSTPVGDLAETNAVKQVFGSDVPLVSSTKSMMGHMLGGAGAVEAVACVLAMENGLVPPTINLNDPDPECDLDYVANTARKVDLKVCMSNSFGFGGHNATLVLARP
ncbi:MAG: beta-ketoacyl-[acyl-carrier-protein] synthase II [Actinobacteria bacterium HGW-Actinobacteria-7]|nr:MAG: beta-ketoacyl-[acyl-carrier-protein] synthase II [Actinobacteria bacterium HGW-Actinobacteria-7]